MKTLKLISAADILTMGNAFLGFLAILYIIDGDKTSIKYAILCLFAAMILDGLDGITARHFGSKHDFGKYLDSIADSISFCCAPAFLVYSIFYDASRGKFFSDSQNSLALFVSIFVALFGILRLARFSVGRQDKIDYFMGLATPANTFFILTFSFLIMDEISKVRVFYASLFFIIAVSLLMISDVKYPKLKGALAYFGTTFILVGIIGVGFDSDIIVASAFIIINVYIFTSPFLIKRKPPEKIPLKLAQGT